MDLRDPGTMLATTHELADGARARIRLTRPSDAVEIERFLGRLPAARSVARLTFYDPRRRLVVAATMPIEGAERIVGLADVALAQREVAEVNVLVDDDGQRTGVGPLLSEMAASLAVRRGATRLKAPRGNAPALRLLERLGPTVRTVEDGEPVTYTRVRAA